MKLTAQSLGLIGLLGGLGGAINAWLCYAELPVPVGMRVWDNNRFEFVWPIIPAGVLHGALLAIVAVGAAWLLWSTPVIVRLVVAPLVGWLAGWLSWIPIDLFGFGPTSLHPSGIPGVVWRAVTWPAKAFDNLSVLWAPYFYFGLVSLLYYGALTLGSPIIGKRLWRQMVVGSVSGVLGSLWWWCDFKPWYFSLIHGTIWGSLVGYGVWRAQAGR